MLTLTQLILILLVILWAVVLFGGFLLGHPTPTNPQRIPRPTRMGASLVLVIFAWGWWLLGAEGDLRPLALWVAVGMTLGFLGDLFMARLIVHDDRYVFGGIGAFSLGHMAYIIGMLGYSRAAGLEMRADALLLWEVAAVIGWVVVVLWGNRPTPLHVAALVYAMLLAGTAGIATGLALQDRAFVPVAVGAALFLFSDLVLAGQLFGRVRFAGGNDLVWLTYSPGQMLIVAGLALPVLL
ncbi:MAG: lysoplasmalogenase [bacterium]|nr:lysoplasmalogenase [bacterium]